MSVKLIKINYLIEDYFIAGIAGIYALSQDALKVDFQDYVSFK